MLCVHCEQYGADVCSCTDKGIRGKLFPDTASGVNDGTQFVILTRAVRAYCDKSATWAEVTECVGDVLNVLAVRKRRIHQNPVKCSKLVVALQEIAVMDMQTR